MFTKLTTFMRKKATHRGGDGGGPAEEDGMLEGGGGGGGSDSEKDEDGLIIFTTALQTKRWTVIRGAASQEGAQDPLGRPEPSPRYVPVAVATHSHGAVAINLPVIFSVMKMTCLFFW